MGFLFWLIIGAIAGFIAAWYYFGQQCRLQLADRDDEIARLRRELANAKSEPGPAQKPAVPAPAKNAAPPAAPAAAIDDEADEADEADESQLLLQSPDLNVEPDDLTRIKGIGKVLQAKLNELGIVTYRQIAEFTPADISRVNEKLDFPGRIEREKWVEQAQELSQKGTST